MNRSLATELSDEASELIRKGEDGFVLVNHLTDIVDRVLVSSFMSSLKGVADKYAVLALVAVGGYGRREILPHSDIDIMLLSDSNDKEIKDAAQAVLYSLWDQGLNISHSFRTLSGCVNDAMKDLQTRTALLDCRFLTGNELLFHEFNRDIYQKLLFKDKKNFTAEIIRDIDRRHKTAGETLYLLEPNIKEGRGGLRDIHAISWLAKSELRIGTVEEYQQFLSAYEYRDFIRSYKFLLKMRSCLHIQSARRNDVLSAEFHDNVASMLGFRDTKMFFASEIMMRGFYLKSKSVSDILQKVINMCGKKYFHFRAPFLVKKISDDFYLSRNEIIVKNSDIFKDTSKIFEAFKIYSTTGKDFSFQIEELLKSRAIFINKKSRSSQKAIHYFREILKGNRVYETLKKMHDTGVLGRFIPEFGRLRHLVILEVFHKYTVDEHTLIAVRNLENLKNTRHARLMYLAEVLKKVRQDILFLAILLHDIGKGISKRHEDIGYIIIKGVLERLLIDQSDRQKIEFIVKNHIYLAKLALTRDTGAPETFTQLAATVGNEENLDSLFLMTYADMSAVNPSFWNEWKSSILYGLYTKARNHLMGIRQDPYSLLDKKLKIFVEGMSERYLISNTIEEIRSDEILSKDAKKVKLAVSIKEKNDSGAEVTVITDGMQRLFSRVVGVLSSRGLNIISARLFTGKNDIVIRRIVVSNWKQLFWDGMEAGIREDLRKTILLGEFIIPKLQNPGDTKPQPKRFEVFIEIDNETSDQYTILEVMLPDKIGLLYDITMRLYNWDIDLLSAVINTEAGTANDVFYLQRSGSKLGLEDCMRILNDLWSVESAIAAGESLK